MSNEKPHPLELKIQGFQRQTARGYICPLCKNESGFSSEQKLFDHGTASHPGIATISRDSREWKDYLTAALSKAKQKHERKPAPHPIPGPSKPASIDPMKQNVGDDVHSPSRSYTPASIPGPARSAEKKIEDLTRLSLYPEPATTTIKTQEGRGTPSPPSNPLKRAAVGESCLSDQPTESGHTHAVQRNRRAKALSGGSFIPKDPEFDRKASVAKALDTSHDRNDPPKKLFDPSTDRTSFTSNPRKTGKADRTPGSRRIYDSRSHLFRSKKTPVEDVNYNLKSSPKPEEPNGIGKSFVNNGLPVETLSFRDQLADQPGSDDDLDADPDLLLQPETRPISHEQLVVEVKGIYAGLVMVEAKCIDVDDKQSLAAQESDPQLRVKLKPEQWQALIALHKTLLHEHHDFFLASQHPSASPALSRLAAKYSMPARMWRHGIHAFLEVLRHRLPESLDHMLAFIYIAYSMMALLYETVPTFEDTWIECLGDLGRYRMAIEDDDIRDREVWSGVARFWYAKAADKSPNVGRLYHHLAILARPYTLQQLSLYTRSLTCILPFESAKGSIMTLFNPILEERDSAYHRSPSMETIFIKAHGILFTNGSMEVYFDSVQQLLSGLIDNNIGRITAKFKEQGVFAALSNIASLFEYGALRVKGGSRSTLRLAYEDLRRQKGTHVDDQHSENVEATSAPQEASLSLDPMTAREKEVSLLSIARASTLAFGNLSVALRRIGDRNVDPLVHVYFAFLNSIVKIESAFKPLENEVPWSEIASFLNSLAKTDNMSPRVLNKAFPKPDKGFGRPLPEDFNMRGHLWSEDLYPSTWFSDAAIDDEERALELPSMAGPRRERVLWHGHRIAASKKWLLYNESSKTFIISDYAKGLRRSEPEQLMQPITSSPDQDSIMSGLDTDEAISHHNADVKGERAIEASKPGLQPSPKATLPKTRNVVPTRILMKDDTKMSDHFGNGGITNSPPMRLDNVDSVEWLKGEDKLRLFAPQKPADVYSSNPGKPQIINILDAPDGKDLTKS